MTLIPHRQREEQIAELKNANVNLESLKTRLEKVEKNTHPNWQYYLMLTATVVSACIAVLSRFSSTSDLEKNVLSLELNDLVRIADQQMTSSIQTNGNCNEAESLWNNSHRNSFKDIRNKMIELEGEDSTAVVDLYANNLVRRINTLSNCNNISW